MERLQKTIANSGYTSRRKAEQLIAEGKVTVNGETITELGFKTKAGDIVTVEGIMISKESKEYYLLNKPRGYISAVSDDLGRKVVTDLINTNARIYPVGRLDYDTTGLLILTNDGDFANKLIHPSFGLKKTYVAKIKGNLTMESFHKLKDGIMLDKTLCQAVKIKIKKSDKAKQTDLISITVNVGVNRVVKRMFESVGHQVIKLKRESIDFLTLDNLNSGDYRKLTKEEINLIKTTY